MAAAFWVLAWGLIAALIAGGGAQAMGLFGRKVAERIAPQAPADPILAQAIRAQAPR